MRATPWAGVAEQRGGREAHEQPDGHQYGVWPDEYGGRHGDAQREGQTDDRDRCVCSELAHLCQPTR